MAFLTQLTNQSAAIDLGDAVAFNITYPLMIFLNGEFGNAVVTLWISPDGGTNYYPGPSWTGPVAQNIPLNVGLTTLKGKLTVQGPLNGTDITGGIPT